MNTAPLMNFLMNFQTQALPRIKQDGKHFTFTISQSLAADPLVQEVASISKGEGLKRGNFMGVGIEVVGDCDVKEY